MRIELCNLFDDLDIGLYVGTVQYRVKVLEVYLVYLVFLQVEGNIVLQIHFLGVAILASKLLPIPS